MLSNEESLKKLEQQQIIWIASVRPDGRPHMSPVWFIYYEGKIYVSTDPKSVKVRNLLGNPHAVLALEDGLHPVICEATARRLPPPWDEEILKIFREIYDWDITTESQYNDLWEFTPVKWLTW
jgi:F420H(2)-dependent biliverdin reductase